MEKTVYILEDDKNIGELVQCTLEMNGVSCRAYPTVKEFWEAMREKPPVVALLDVMLPDGNGLDVLAEIKRKYEDVY